MDPISWITAILAAPKVKGVIQGLAKDALGTGKQALFRRLQPSAREKAAKQAIQIFAEAWNQELEDKCEISAALPGYRDQLKTLIETAAVEIAEGMDPEAKKVDLSLVASTWSQLSLDRLPEGFDWKFVAQDYARAIRIYIKQDSELRAGYDTALRERAAEAADRSALALDRLAPDPGFDLTAYRHFLIGKKCNALQLAVLHTNTYEFGGNVTLWSVFVPQSARESAPIPEIPPELQRRLREEGHLTQSPDEQELADLRQRYQSSPIRPVLEILDRNRQVVVVGDPGSGKTSLLKYLSLRWAKDDLGPLPLLVDLKEYVNDRKGLLEYCHSAHDVFRLSAAELRKRLQTGQAAFYLDGLDEIFDPIARQSVIEEIVVLSATYTQAPIVITSRKVGYEPERLRNAGFLHATLEEFDLSQMIDFLRQWHRIAEADDNERAQMLQRLERALKESRAIRELAGNPLLLTMMAILNRNQELPRNRVSLYREAGRVLLDDWDARKALPVGEFDREDKESLLRELAGDMQQAEGGLAGNLIEQSRLKQKVREFLAGLHIQDSRAKANRLVKQLAERNFILAWAGANRFSFVHRTFLEYFCALWFVDRFQKKQDLTLEQLKTDVFGRHWKEEKWHEVLRLIVGMVEEKKAEALILFLMAQDGRRDKFANLMLAAGCLNEVRTRGTIQATGLALWERFVGEAVRFDPPYYYEEYQEFGECGLTRQAAVRWIASAWKGEGARDWLRSAALDDRDWIVRQAAVRELAGGWNNDPETLPWLKDRVRDDKDGAVRQSAAQELARSWKDDPDTLPLLKDRARVDEDSGVRYTAVVALARHWRDEPDTLPLLQNHARKDRSSTVRLAAVQELARYWRDDMETLPLLKDRARKDKHFSVRLAALQELAQGWKDDPETPRLLADRARNDKDNDVRRAAMQELVRGWKDHPETLPWFKDRTQDNEDDSVRQAAIQVLARAWRDEPGTLPWLHDLVRNDKSQSAREAALRELARGWRDDPKTLSLLKNHARSEEIYAGRQIVVLELARGWKDDPDTLPWFKDRARNDKDNNVRQAALKEIARGWKDDPETLPLLQDRARNDKDRDVRRVATRALARGWKDDPETVSLLKNRARSDRDSYVRQTAVQELARGWKHEPETLSLLKDRIRYDEDYAVRRAAIQEVARGWKDDPETLPWLKDRTRNDRNSDVRQAAMQTLSRGWKDDLEILPMLQSRIRIDENYVVRWAAVQDLARGWKDDPETLHLLKDRAQNDPHADVRQTAVQELARGWKDNPEALLMLKDCARNDEQYAVRQAAVQGLARGWKDNSEVMDFLRNLN